MSTTATFIAINAATTAANSAAIASANRQATEQCKAFMAGFNPQTSEVAGMRYYASCVQRAYPAPSQELQGTGLLVAKGCVLVLLIAAFIGAVYGWREDRHISGVILFAFLFALAPICVGIVLMLLYAAGQFLLS